jgi:hypothetical protein
MLDLCGVCKDIRKLCVFFFLILQFVKLSHGAYTYGCFNDVDKFSGLVCALVMLSMCCT